MAIKKIPEEFNLPFAQALSWKHVLGEGAADYVFLNVVWVREEFHGNICGMGQDPRDLVVTLKVQECCANVEQRFHQRFPDHACGAACFSTWQPMDAMFEPGSIMNQ